MPESNELRIVGFEVEPRSYRPVKFQPEQEPAWNFTAHVPLYLEEQKNLPNAERNFDFTYSIQTVMDETTAWTLRMEHY